MAAVFDRWVKNIDAASIRVLGTVVAPGVFLKLDMPKAVAYSESVELDGHIQNDRVLLSLDGSTTLTKSDSLIVISQVVNSPQICVDDPEFNSRDVLGALKETKDAGTGNVDGGKPTSNYGGTAPIDGGTP